jgi:hypothetical protein
MSIQKLHILGVTFRPQRQIAIDFFFPFRFPYFLYDLPHIPPFHAVMFPFGHDLGRRELGL